MLASSVGAAAAASASGCSFANNSFLFLFEKGGKRDRALPRDGLSNEYYTYGEVAYLIKFLDGMIAELCFLNGLNIID